MPYLAKHALLGQTYETFGHEYLVTDAGISGHSSKNSRRIPASLIAVTRAETLTIEIKTVDVIELLNNSYLLHDS